MDLTPDAARAAARAADAAERPDEAYRLLLPLAEAGDQPVRSLTGPRWTCYRGYAAVPDRRASRQP